MLENQHLPVIDHNMGHTITRLGSKCARKPVETIVLDSTGGLFEDDADGNLFPSTDTDQMDRTTTINVS